MVGYILHWYDGMSSDARFFYTLQQLMEEWYGYNPHGEGFDNEDFGDLDINDNDSILAWLEENLGREDVIETLTKISSVQDDDIVSYCTKHYHNKEL